MILEMTLLTLQIFSLLPMSHTNVYSCINLIIKPLAKYIICLDFLRQCTVNMWEAYICAPTDSSKLLELIDFCVLYFYYFHLNILHSVPNYILIYKALLKTVVLQFDCAIRFKIICSSLFQSRFTSNVNEKWFYNL